MSSPADDAGTSGAPTFPLGRDEDRWRAQLSEAQYRVLRGGGTEVPFTGEYTDVTEVGIYSCRACGSELFRSEAKFDSHCGWPSFYEPGSEDAVLLLEDRSAGMARTEVRCAACGSHLGHVFRGEGYATPTDERWCINSSLASAAAARLGSGASSVATWLITPGRCSWMSTACRFESRIPTG